MKLRQKSKRDQALDAVASVAKTWSEWHLGKRVSKTASKGAKKASKLKDTGKGTRLKIAGGLALLGGIGAAAAAKLKGGKAEPLSPPPGPAADMADPPPNPVSVEDRAPGPAAGATVPSPPRSPIVVEPTPIVVEDLASDAEPPDEPPDAEPPDAEPDDEAEPPDAEASDEEPAAEAADKRS
jgi:hypothetical protein